MSNLALEKIHDHLFDRAYMDGVDRDDDRVRLTGEVFTRRELVNEMLDRMDPDLFCDPTKTFLDPACGDGEFLAGALYRKLENGIELEQALSTIYGVDIMRDNVMLCRQRLCCGSDSQTVRKVLKSNIICKDALDYFAVKDDGQYLMDIFSA